MPAPIPDLSRDQQCHHYQAPTGQRCGSPAIKGEYYCYFHHIKHANRFNRRVLIDPEVTGLELPVIEDRATIFVAITAIVHRLAANTLDTKRAGQMLYGLQNALLALPPDPAPEPAETPAPEAHSGGCCCRHQKRCRKPAAEPAQHPEPSHAADSACHSERSEESPHSEPAASNTQPTTQRTTGNEPRTPPKKISITKESLIYFLRARHCYSCNAELFPAHELTYRRYPGAPPEIVEENDHIRRLSERYPSGCSPALLLDDVTAPRPSDPLTPSLQE